ncbi:MAG: 2Fe-2S iron-sulfur cluster-binding protein [Brevirhabdus sp.]
MTRQVTFEPSGRRCEIEAHETVLAAALRAGLKPDYGCSNGNCGTCVATLRSGQIEQTRHCDFTLSDAEKLGGGFLMCAHRAISDITVEADVTQSPEDIPAQQIETKVKALTPLDAQVMQLHLQTPRSQRLRFVSGQSVALEIDGGIRKTLPVASCPCDDRNLLFHVPDIPGDAFCEAVFSGQLRARLPVQLHGPDPVTFYFDETDTRPSLILSWHTGFAPIVSLMEHALSLEVMQNIHLHRFSPTPAAQYLSNLCRAWSDAYDNIEAELSDTRLTLLSSEAECERALSAAMAQYPELPRFNVYVAGPPNFVSGATRALDGFGVPAGQVRTHTDWVEVFE